MPRDGKMSVHASARVRGVAEGICLAHGLPLFELSTQDVKRALCGDPGASKGAVAGRLHVLLRQDVRILRADDNATDALAVALVGPNRFGSDFSSRLSSGVVQHRASSTDELDLLDDWSSMGERR
jgi:Holliday junction resolvasome RuvABC endonuclease subunit